MINQIATLILVLITPTINLFSQGISIAAVNEFLDRNPVQITIQYLEADKEHVLESLDVGIAEIDIDDYSLYLIRKETLGMEFGFFDRGISFLDNNDKIYIKSHWVQKNELELQIVEITDNSMTARTQANFRDKEVEVKLIFKKAILPFRENHDIVDTDEIIGIKWNLNKLATINFGEKPGEFIISEETETDNSDENVLLFKKDGSYKGFGGKGFYKFSGSGNFVKLEDPLIDPSIAIFPVIYDAEEGLRLIQGNYYGNKILSFITEE
ncbi:MAG: hypothetical protein RBT61_08510 [Candidatus Kapabacteria bacterium]|jgi:hypothetical protein|nr:hypothetical protein [Candidatus Kapabacteria bacterium]